MNNPYDVANPRPPFRSRKRVEFRDTDAAGLMHFSTFFTFMEEVEHEFLRELGRTVMPSGEGPRLSWPRAAASCNYVAPLRFEDEFDVELSIARLGTKSVTYEFRFVHGDSHFATGSVTAVCCVLEKGRPPKSTPIPADFAALLAPHTRTPSSDHES